MGRNDIKNIKTVGRYTIDYCNGKIWEGYTGIIFNIIHNFPTKLTPGIYVYLHDENGYLKEMMSFVLSEDPEKNKETLKNIVEQMEQRAIKLNQIDDKKERDGRIMLSGVK